MRLKGLSCHCEAFGVQVRRVSKRLKLRRSKRCEEMTRDEKEQLPDILLEIELAVLTTATC